LPPDDVFPLFRAQWNNLALREEITIRLAARPEIIDRDKFMIGLASPRTDVVIASAGRCSNCRRINGRSCRS